MCLILGHESSSVDCELLESNSNVLFIFIFPSLSLFPHTSAYDVWNNTFLMDEGMLNQYDPWLLHLKEMPFVWLGKKQTIFTI